MAAPALFAEADAAAEAERARLGRRCVTITVTTSNPCLTARTPASQTRKETMVSTLMIVILVFIAAVFFLLVDNLAAVVVRWILGFGG